MQDGIIQLISGKAKAAVSLFGGHVLSYEPAGEPPVLWLSNTAVFDHKTPIRGGVPIIWPWFGSHPSDSSQPSHGFARRTMWQLDGQDALPEGQRLRLSLTNDSAAWAHPYTLRLAVSLGEALTIQLTTENRGAEPFRYGVALHSYFQVADIGQTAVTGLDGVTYIDQLDGNQRKVQQGDIRFAAETDNIYVGTEETVVIEDRGHGRQIVVEKSGSRSTVVWNPWIEKARRMADFEDERYRQMVCVETGNVADDVQWIEPGETETITAVIRVNR